jgi:hypothetical protein
VRLPRGTTITGSPTKFFAQVAADNNLQMWMSAKGLNIRGLKTQGAGATPDFVYGPPFPPQITIHPDDASLYTPTMIGTPEQTQQGASFRILLDSRPTLCSLIKLELSGMKALPIFPGQGPYWFADDRTYIVAGLRHRGDTRGNEWYTDVMGYTQDWDQIFRGYTS